MPTYIIATSGPLIRKDFDNAATARAYVERSVPLKRGWVGKWVQVQRNHRWQYRVCNSKGTFQHSVALWRVTRITDLPVRNVHPGDRR